MRYHRTFLLLLASGHSGAKAAEIVLDASRGSRWALDWIRLAKRLSGSGGLMRLMAQIDPPVLLVSTPTPSLKWTHPDKGTRL